jgi:Holliday junction resolvasome RuvABC endonuclease subunit
LSRLTVEGLDLSLTSTGVAVATGGALGGDPATFRIRSSFKGLTRMMSVVDRIGKTLDEYQPGLVVVEGPAYHARGSHFHEAAGLWWMVARLIHERKIPMAVVPPTVLKKYATGSGAADKSAMCVAAATRFHRSQIQPDEADALWLAAAGLQHYGLPVVAVPALQARALDATGRTHQAVVAWPEMPHGVYAVQVDAVTGGVPA